MDFEHVLVVGAGQMGGGIAQVVAGSGRSVSLYDAAPGAAERALETIGKSARKLADHFVFEAGGVDDRFHDWVCAKAQIGDEVWTVQCSRPKGTKDQQVTFDYGA